MVCHVFFSLEISNDGGQINLFFFHDQGKTKIIILKRSKSVFYLRTVVLELNPMSDHIREVFFSLLTCRGSQTYKMYKLYQKS